DERIRRGGSDDLGRDQRAGIEADRTALDEALATQGDEVGRAGAGANEIDGHGEDRWRDSPPPCGEGRAEWGAKAPSPALRATSASWGEVGAWGGPCGAGLGAGRDAGGRGPHPRPLPARGRGAEGAEGSECEAKAPSPALRATSPPWGEVG